MALIREILWFELKAWACSMTAQIFSVPDDVSETKDTNRRALDHDHIA
jgi:hypothetical protein